MNQVRAGLLILVICVAFGTHTSQVRAADDASTADSLADLKDQVQELKAELAEIRTMLANMQGAKANSKSNPSLAKIERQLATVLKELAAIKKASGKPTRRPPDTTIYDVNIGSSPTLGPADAPITIVEFSEFQCPYCTREFPKIKEVMDAYPGQIQVVFKHYPLSFHKNAKPAAATSIFAYQQLGSDGFWKMHDLIMAGGTKKLAHADLMGYAKQMNLDTAALDALLKDSKAIDALLAEDLAEAKKCKVRGTPTILINGLKLANRNVEGYKKRIDEILKKKKPSKKKS